MLMLHTNSNYVNRYLDSQLVEIRNAIEKMLRAELERNLSADLNRPIELMTTFYDKVSIRR